MRTPLFTAYKAVYKVRSAVTQDCHFLSRYCFMRTTSLTNENYEWPDIYW